MIVSEEYCDSILAFCVASDDWENVLDVLEVMKQQNLHQEHSTYTACLQVSQPLNRDEVFPKEAHSQKYLRLSEVLLC